MSCRSSSRLTKSLRSSLTKSTFAQCSRRYASQAAATAPDSSSTSEPVVLETTATSPTIAHRLHAAIVLSRAPVISQDQHPFERAFYLYQRRLNERTATPFPRFFYFNEKTPDIIDFRNQVKSRKTPARDIGVYDAYSREGWNDEVLVGEKLADLENQMQSILKDERVEITAEDRAKEKEKEEAEAVAASEETEQAKDAAPVTPNVSTRPMARITKADETGDEQSLDRALQRSLYLVVKGKDDMWRFPTVELELKESLRTAASRALEQTAGVDMNTWLIGNQPMGFWKATYAEDKIKTDERGHHVAGEMTFFMKARIMAGQADLAKNVLGVKEFKWLTKDEIKPLVIAGYWSAIKDMIPER